MAKPTPERPFVPSGFFAFRTPLLPFEELEAFSAGLEAPGAGGDPEALEAALAADRERLRSRLAALADRPEVLEAVFLASPSLCESLAAWRAQPDGKKGQRAERALLRYVYRMAARATPFGLFSGCSLGPVETAPGSPTRIAVAPRGAYERHTRLDMDYLFALCEDLGRDSGLREVLLYRPNTSLYRAAGRLRYAEARLENKVRSHHLVAVDASDFLEEALRRAEGGARARDVADALVAFDPDGEVTPEEAMEFVTELIDSQILVSDLSTPVTGPEAIHDLIAQLGSLAANGAAAGAVERLAQARDALTALDAAGPGQEPARYEAIAETLRELPTPVEMSRLFQLDMVKPADRAVLGADVVEEIGHAVELLYRLASERPQEGLDKFRKDFNERYEGREIPLLEALDEEVGIGFERSADSGAEASPLLRGLALGGTPGEPTVPWGRVQSVLLNKVHEALARGAKEIEITPEDLDRMAPSDGSSGNSASPKSPMPDSFHVMATLAAPSPEALERGEFRLLFDNAGGPSGARLLGRFCHADPELSRHVEEHLRAEEARNPEALFAEIVHLPQGRIGNILARPVLREYEIPFLGRSGAPPERQIPVSDLRVSVAGNRIVLRSARLGREVIPRLTSAHNFWHGSLGVYRFLCMLQSQGQLGGLSWSWGALDGAPFLPRVTCSRLVLTRASWWMTQTEIKALAKAKGAERFAAVQQWREKRGLPRLVALVDADNELLVDLDNVLSVDTFLDVVEERDRARLVEFFPGPDELPATGLEGRFLHEILVPWVRKPREAREAVTARPERGRTVAPALRRSFPPGSEWLYLKLYTGSSTADGLLREVVAPVAREALAEGMADGWFFIRYGDPEWHLRLRFHGRPAELGGRLLPRLHEELDPRLADGRLWKVQLDTYEREVERYGGPEGMLLAESIFEADSEAVLAIVGMLEGDEGADVRWRIALRGIDMLLTDLGLEGEERMRTLRAMKESFAREFGGGKSLRVQLDQKFRKEGRSLVPLLDPAGDEASELAPALAVLHRRSERLAPLCAELRAREAAGRLNQSLADLAPSFVHMNVNRMIRSAGRAHELVLYDFLYQLHESRAARARKGGGKLGETRTTRTDTD
ncbi:MAG: lantibiotic biosynthesis protein [Acidobacteriota bacterium]|jgi:thiopeptide-type bacteriocin biosynthesis protein|nr:lantibiotic biosynthesis protein [Acidobacteriota bacterium]